MLNLTAFGVALCLSVILVPVFKLMIRAYKKCQLKRLLKKIERSYDVTARTGDFYEKRR